MVDTSYASGSRYALAEPIQKNSLMTFEETLFPDMRFDDRKLPLLLFSSPHNDITEETIIQKIKEFEAKDDVFSGDFLSSRMILQSEPTSWFDISRSIRPGRLRELVPWQLQTVLPLAPLTDGSFLPCGPYFLYRGQLFEAWKLPLQFAIPQSGT